MPKLATVMRRRPIRGSISEFRPADGRDAARRGAGQYGVPQRWEPRYTSL